MTLLEGLLLIWTIPIAGVVYLYFTRSITNPMEYFTCSNCGRWNYSFAKSCRHCRVKFSDTCDVLSARKVTQIYEG